MTIKIELEIDDDDVESFTPLVFIQSSNDVIQGIIKNGFNDLAIKEHRKFRGEHPIAENRNMRILGDIEFINYEGDTFKIKITNNTLNDKLSINILLGHEDVLLLKHAAQYYLETYEPWPDDDKDDE